MRLLSIMALCAVANFALNPSPARAGNYEYHPGSMLKLGGTFDPQNLTVAYASCLRYDREYAVHRLKRKEDTPPAAGGAAPAPTIPINIAADNELAIEQIKTREHMYKFLNISTSVSGQYKFFSASASLNYESEETFDSDSFVFGVRGRSTFGELGLIEPNLTEDARRLSANREAFYTRCGREWVSQETRGVLIAVIYTIKNVSQSQRSKLEAAISGGFHGAVLSVDVEGKLKQIFESAFISNYYSAKIHAIGGKGVSDFAETVNNIDNPTEVLKKISEYMKSLTYETSVPLSFASGSLDQFLAQEQPALLFDTFNRRISDLFLAYEEYRSRRSKIWRFLSDDLQSAWPAPVDTATWAELSKVDDVLGTIEAKAQVCREAAAIASKQTNIVRRGQPGPASRTPTPNLDLKRSDFIQDFSFGISARVVGKATKDYAGSTKKLGIGAETCPALTATSDEIDHARSALCECLRKDDTLYLKDRYVVSAVPSVKVVHEKTVFAPRSLLYVSVTAAERLTNVVLKDQTGAVALTLKGGVDPDSGPVWFGSILYRDASGTPPAPDKLPYYLEVTDAIGRTYTKPVMVLD